MTRNPRVAISILERAYIAVRKLSERPFSTQGFETATGRVSMGAEFFRVPYLAVYHSIQNAWEQNPNSPDFDIVAATCNIVAIPFYLSSLNEVKARIPKGFISGDFPSDYLEAFQLLIHFLMMFESHSSSRSEWSGVSQEEIDKDRDTHFGFLKETSDALYAWGKEDSPFWNGTMETPITLRGRFIQ